MDLHSTVFRLKQESERLQKEIESQHIEDIDPGIGVDPNLLERKFLMDRAIRDLLVAKKQVKILFWLVIIACSGSATVMAVLWSLFKQ